ncbi:hypothetical protein MJO29_005276 [Puccinia striiformis f. sp. tritici]|uniref:Cyclin N-terminal domain-containing protein n=1 Tax=Puccinia striiformis f. sp. tritici PST-78 TaxID=1165861 RepID=A0A0L0UTM8_9BASI|nr:hypothetical protein Pst134EB_010456 [Puccinia striiformis f. sp. tritici]KAI7960208.1 hypothetical protein MJO29_005276 [Puccinia striiformis f. sp. tritici]KAI9630752.1 hypothetical protein KEM48_013651 [Puccinia striiformis f. sp. tritici PST-130]KNE90393.1 hypothetical protein PSTG_16139 [Puccinia striiformis f. sp. tritici PST-78]
MSSNTSSSRDPYYGYGPISMLSTSIVTTLFPPMVTNQEEPYPVTETGKRMPKLVDFIAYALYRTRLNDAIVHSALLLLTRLKQRYPSARGTPSSPHRLFLSALMLASKMSMDDTYSNKSWVIVGQSMFSISEVNRMERELFGFLNSNCYVTKEELKSWCQEWCGPIEEEEVEELYELEETVHHSGPSMVPSEATGCDSSDSNSPISCSTTTTSSPSPRTPEEGSEGEVEARNRWKTIEHPVSLLPSSANVKPTTHVATSISSIQHILNSPF